MAASRAPVAAPHRGRRPVAPLRCPPPDARGTKRVAVTDNVCFERMQLADAKYLVFQAVSRQRVATNDQSVLFGVNGVVVVSEGKATLFADTSRYRHVHRALVCKTVITTEGKLILSTLVVTGRVFDNDAKCYPLDFLPLVGGFLAHDDIFLGHLGAASPQQILANCKKQFQPISVAAA